GRCHRSLGLRWPDARNKVEGIKKQPLLEKIIWIVTKLNTAPMKRICYLDSFMNPHEILALIWGLYASEIYTKQLRNYIFLNDTFFNQII
ncbi:hypothetical protein LD39_20790, partial [Halobacillus sp. BBL2006]